MLIRWAAVLLASMSVVACSTTYVVRNDAPGKLDRLESGHEAQVYLRDGTRREVTVVRVTDTELVHRSGRIPLGDIAKVRYQKVSAGKTALGVSAWALFLLAIGGWVVAEALDDD